jgi:hypothetical protein
VIEFGLKLRDPLELDVLFAENTVEQLAALVQHVDELIEFLAPHAGPARFRNAPDLASLASLALGDSHESDCATLHSAAGRRKLQIDPAESDS